MKGLNHEKYWAESDEAKEAYMVRVCKKCGTVYSQQTRECVSCCQKLGEPMDSDSAEKLGTEIRISRGSQEPAYEVQQMKQKLASAGRLSIAALGLICVDIIAYAITLFTEVSVPRSIETPALMVICAMMILLIANLVFCFAPEIVFRSKAETGNVRKSSTSHEGALYNSGTLRRKRIEGAFRFSKLFGVYCVALPVICNIFGMAVLMFYLYYLV